MLLGSVSVTSVDPTDTLPSSDRASTMTQTEDSPLTGSLATARGTSSAGITSQTTLSSEYFRNITSTTNTPPSSSFPVAIVGALVGVVIALLIIIIIVGVIIVVCFRRRKRRKINKMMSKNEDDGMELNTCGPGFITYNNCNYEQTHINSDITKQPLPPAVITDEDTVSPVLLAGGDVSTDEDTVSPVLPAVGDVSTGEDTVSPVLPADGAMGEKEPHNDQVIMVTEVSAAKEGDLESNQLIDSRYSTVTVEEEHVDLQQAEPSSSTTSPETEDKASYSLVVKRSVPTVPMKSPELYQDLEETGGSGGEGKAVQGGEHDEEKENVKTLAYINVDVVEGGGRKREREDPVNYTMIKDETSVATPTEATSSEIMPIRATPIGATPTGATFIESVLDGRYTEIEVDEDAHLDAIYDNPDAFISENEGEDIYETVYSESLQPSMFAKPPEQEIFDEREEEGEEEVEDVYAPIYSLPTALESSGTVLQFKPENIHRIKTLGTGYFGKVLLADTVGLSLKELKMSETDDDKSKSVRVAVKTLRRKPEKQRKLAFDKELKFMSRLNHPNVVRTLGACMVDTPFIVMEYMEKGDLNDYLQDFDTIEQGNAPPTDLTISVGTLVSMSAQIADAMKYLASRNYIHRDLATRNCLVGPESRIKIADFGMSKSLYESHYYTIKGHVVLPVRWMARECFYGKFSAKTDVWAFGVTLWEIFTLAKDIPYEDMDDSEVAADASRMEGDRQLLERSNDCPPEVYNVMLLCWKDKPSDRATFETLHETLLSLDS